MGLTGDASRHLLMDPEFWRPRIERLAREPRQLAIFPRPDLSRPGIEVMELRLRAHDGARLTARGLGATKPVAPNTSAEGRQANRRVELVKGT